MATTVSNLRKFQEFRRQNLKCARIILEGKDKGYSGIMLEWSKLVQRKYTQTGEDGDFLFLENS